MSFIKKSILAISGSNKTASLQERYIYLIRDIAEDHFDLKLYNGISSLPHFNPELDGDDPPKEISKFREKLNTADVVLICTPEYAHGVPGSLKNAIDWTVSSSNFVTKPVILITASTAGYKVHQSMLDILHVLQAFIPEYAAVHIPFAKTKIDDSATHALLKNMIDQLKQAI